MTKARKYPFTITTIGYFTVPEKDVEALIAGQANATDQAKALMRNLGSTELTKGNIDGVLEKIAQNELRKRIKEVMKGGGIGGVMVTAKATSAGKSLSTPKESPNE